MASGNFTHFIQLCSVADLLLIQDDAEAVSEGQDMGSGEKPPGLLFITPISCISEPLRTNTTQVTMW